jgi:hypothetical protein
MGPVFSVQWPGIIGFKVTPKKRIDFGDHGTDYSRKDMEKQGDKGGCE